MPRLAAIAALLLAACPATAQNALRVAHPFAPASSFARSCEQLSFAFVREPGSAFTVKLLSGREAAALGPLMQALRSGKLDLACLPASSYTADLPEASIVAASDASPAAVRGNGGMAALEALHQNRLGLKYLGWIDSGSRSHFYLVRAPTRRDGLPALTGLTVRADAATAAVAAALGAAMHDVERAGVYSALAAGRLGGVTAFPAELSAFKWDSFLKHRIDAPLQQSDIGVVMSAAVWRKLDAKSRAMVDRIVIEHEESSRGAALKEALEHEAALRAAGVVFHALDEDASARFAALAAQRWLAGIEAELRWRNLPLDTALQLRKGYFR